MLSRLFGQQDRGVGQATAWGSWSGEAPMVYAGVMVDDRSSLQLLTVYGCVRLITDSIATLPVDVYRKVNGAQVEVARPVWLDNPTTSLDFTAWCTQVLSSLLLHGNAYIVVTRNAAGSILELIPLDPAKVTVRRDNGRLVYLVHGMPVPGEIVHIPGMMLAGTDVGLSPVEYARQSIGLGLATTKYGSEFFTGEGNMPGVIEMPGRAQPDTLRSIADQWRKRRREGGRGLPGVLQEGATWRPTGVTNEQMQFLQTRKYQAAEIAAQMFMIDPSELGISVDGTSLTYANLDQRNTRFVRVSLLPWIVRIEKALSGLMMRPRYAKFNVDGLLRSDLPTRYAAYSTGISAGFLLPDEARALEDMQPLPMGVDDVDDIDDLDDDDIAPTSTPEVPA